MMAEKPTRREFCSSPEELTSLFNQWKLSPEGQLAEREIAYAVYRVSTANFDLVEPLRDFTFGFYLAQQEFPISGKYPFPVLRIDQSGEVVSASCSPRYVFVAESWLQKHLSDNHPSTYLIDTGVEEFSHWVFEQAIKRRSKDYRASLDSHYNLTQENLKRGQEETSAKLKEMESFNPLKYTYLLLSGRIGQRLAETKTLLLESESALLKHSSTFEEYMGIVWRNQVSQRYYPWAEEAKYNKEQREKVLAYKRQKAAERRQS